MKGFSILITLQGVDALLVSQYLIENDMKCDYSFKSNNADEFACIACIACVDKLNRCSWVLHPKGKMVNGC